MAKFKFNSGFYLLLTDGERLRFEAGEQDVPDAVSGHEYLASMGARLPDVAPEPVVSAPSDGEPTGEGEGAGAPAPDHDSEEAHVVSEPAPKLPEAEDPAPQATEEPAAEPEAEPDEKAALVAEAEALGIDVDGRWGVSRLKSAIAAKKAAG